MLEEGEEMFLIIANISMAALQEKEEDRGSMLVGVTASAC